MKVKPKIRNGLSPYSARNFLTASTSGWSFSSSTYVCLRPKFAMPSTPAPRAENERRFLMMPIVSTISIGSRSPPRTSCSVAPSCLVCAPAASLSR